MVALGKQQDPAGLALPFGLELFLESELRIPVPLSPVLSCCFLGERELLDREICMLGVWVTPPAVNVASTCLPVWVPQVCDLREATEGAK